jgi:hypothetical protein
LGVWEGYLGGLGVIRLHVRQIEQRNTTGLSFVLSRILFFSEERGWHHSILIWLFFVSFRGSKLQNVNILFDIYRGDNWE